MSDDQWVPLPDEDDDEDGGNFYAPPSADLGAGFAGGFAGEAEQVRVEHIAHEASIKSMGCLYYLGAVLMIPLGLGMLFAAASGKGGERGVALMIGALYGGLGMLYLFVGRGLRSFQGWARGVAVIISCIGLLGIPLGTIISIYFLVLLLGAKGARIFAPDYPQIVAQTPHIKYKPPLWNYIVGGLLVLFLIGLVVAAMAA